VRARFASIAQRELKEAREFYDITESGLGARFLDEVEATVKRIIAQTMAWTPMSPRTRRCRTKRFPFGMFYQIRREEILIV
jgi:galactose-1-phosphate uridylyltransferase